MRERVAFERRQTADDGFGNVVTSDWTELHRCAARIMPLMGGEQVMQRRLTGTQPVVVTVRCAAAIAALTTDDRIRDVRKDKIYNVRSIANFDEQRQFFDIMAEAGVAT
jgi:head-tail adaptor